MDQKPSRADWLNSYQLWLPVLFLIATVIHIFFFQRDVSFTMPIHFAVDVLLLNRSHWIFSFVFVFFHPSGKTWLSEFSAVEQSYFWPRLVFIFSTSFLVITYMSLDLKQGFWIDFVGLVLHLAVVHHAVSQSKGIWLLTAQNSQQIKIRKLIGNGLTLQSLILPITLFIKPDAISIILTFNITMGLVFILVYVQYDRDFRATQILFCARFLLIYLKSFSFVAMIAVPFVHNLEHVAILSHQADSLKDKKSLYFHFGLVVFFFIFVSMVLSVAALYPSIFELTTGLLLHNNLTSVLRGFIGAGSICHFWLDHLLYSRRYEMSRRYVFPTLT